MAQPHEEDLDDFLVEEPDADDPAYQADTRVGEGAYLQIAKLLREESSAHRPPERSTTDEDEQEPTQVLGTAWIPADLQAEIDHANAAATAAAAVPTATVDAPAIPVLAPPAPPPEPPRPTFATPQPDGPVSRRMTTPIATPVVHTAAFPAPVQRPITPAPESPPPAIQRMPMGVPIALVPIAPIAPSGFTPVDLPKELRPSRIAAGEVLVFFIAFLAVLVPSLLLLDRML